MEKLHIQPSEIDMMPFYEYEYTMEIYNDILKERKESESDSHNAQDTANKYNTGNLQRQATKNLSSYKPSMPKISLPKL